MLAPAAALAAFLAFSAPALAGPDWSRPIEVARGGGEKGEWRQNDSRYDYVDDPSVALAEDGTLHVAWVDQRTKDVHFRRHKAGKWLGDAINIAGSKDTFSWLPRIAIAPGDPKRVVVLWQEIIFSGGSHGGDILLARSEDGGASFAAPINLSRSVGGDGKGRINRDVWHNGSQDVVIGADGAIYVAWTEYDGPLWFAASSDGGKTFTPPRHVAGSNSRPARAPSLAVGTNRHLYLAWTHGEDDAADIHVMRSTDGGASFGDPTVVARTKGYSDAPKLAADSKGTLHLVFAESERGPFDRSRIVYTRSTDGARSFESPRPISPSGAGFPSLALDGKEGVYVSWELGRGIGFAHSLSAGNDFSPAANIPGSEDPGGGTNGSHQGLLMKKLAANARGELALANSSLKRGEGSRVWLLRASGR